MNNIIEQEINPFYKKYADELMLMRKTNAVEILNEIYNDPDFKKSIFIVDGYYDDAIGHLTTFEDNNKALLKVLREHITSES